MKRENSPKNKTKPLGDSYKKGIGFGITSGIITTLGLIVGLHSGTHEKLAVLGGIFIIAIADAFSDALGIHVSEEAEQKHSSKEIWQATFSTFFTKLIIALTFVIPVLLFDLETAIMVSITYGLILIALFSYTTAKKQENGPWKAVTEHVVIALVVIVAAHFVGDLVRTLFGA